MIRGLEKRISKMCQKGGVLVPLPPCALIPNLLCVEPLISLSYLFRKL